MNAGKVVRIAAALVLLFVGFVMLANLATIWHGALFIALMPVLVWVFNDVLNWALADR